MGKTISRTTRATAKRPRSAKPPRHARTGHLGYASGMGARRVGVGQEAVLEVLRPWLVVRFGSVAGAATKLQMPDHSCLSQMLRNAAKLPESRAAVWAKLLCKNPGEREALQDLLVLANAHERVLRLLGCWEALVQRLGAKLGTGNKRMAKPRKPSKANPSR